MTNAFLRKLDAALMATSGRGIVIAPDLDALPYETARYDDPLLPYTRAIYAATSDLLCAYVFNFAAYLALGAAGAIALERSIRLVGQDRVTVLDGRFSTPDYALLWEESSFGADAITFADVSFPDTFRPREDKLVLTVTEQDTSESRLMPETQRIVMCGRIIDLLPADTLRRARSLDFEARLRSLVQTHVG